ncbi:hypothetical protein IWW49_005767, partial [Coemansia sp. RSA 1797]
MVRRRNNNASEGIPLTFYTDETYSPALKKLMRKIARRLELALNEDFWENMYSYMDTYCFRALDRGRMSSTGSDEEDVDISEAVGHAANPGVADESADEPTRTGLLHNEDTHEDEVHPAQSEDEDTREEEVSHAQSEDEDTREDEAESSAATVSNMSEDLFDMCLDTFGTAAAIGDTP